jgi:signal transduction histidine kinase/signal recognition particle receptor subunit beta
MVQFDNQNRQVKIKIVYYGPAIGGKTTSLQQIHRVLDPERRTRLYSLNTAEDRTLFFDLLSLNLGRIRDFRLSLQLYTVPGQVQYDTTRRTVLAGADGVVFVADSKIEQREANLESLSNLRLNLIANSLDVQTIPVVFQYNKRDLSPIMSLDEMESGLNQQGLPSFPTVAITGEGVIEAFAAIGELTLVTVADKLGVGGNPQALDRLRQQMNKAMAPFLTQDGAPQAAEDIEITVAERGGETLEALTDDDLVTEAVRANLAMGDLNARLDSLSRLLKRKVHVMAGISDYGRAVSNQRDPAAALRLLISTAVKLLQVQGASVLIVPTSGRLREAVVHGFTEDPFNREVDGDGRSIAATLLDRRAPQLVTMAPGDDVGAEAMAVVEKAGFASAISVPLQTQDKVVGLLTVFGDSERSDLDEDDLQLATVLASTAAMGYANAIAWKQMEELSQGLEEQVAERTAELRTSLAQSRRLTDDLAEKKALLEEAYRDLAALDGVKNELINRLSLEFRTPITSLFTAAKVLEREKDIQPEKARRLVTIIHDEGEKLLDMIQSIFQVSVLGAAERDLETGPVPAQDLFRQSIAPLRDLAKDRGVNIVMLIPSGLETISCDRESIEAALRAVVRNAVEFSPDGGEVKLEVRRVTRGDERWLQLRVTDSGVGIPEADLERVREAFWQGDDSRAGKRHGVGLGLAIADRVAKNHGGKFSISSTLGEGTEVLIALPQ